MLTNSGFVRRPRVSAILSRLDNSECLLVTMPTPSLSAQITAAAREAFDECVHGLASCHLPTSYARDDVAGKPVQPVAGEQQRELRYRNGLLLP